jgi:hypothetical protein
MTGNPYYDEADNGRTLVTDGKESGSGRMGALPYNSDDEDENFNGLWGLPTFFSSETLPRLPGTPPRVPGLLNQRAGLLTQAHLSPGTDKDLEELPQLRRSSSYPKTKEK